MNAFALLHVFGLAHGWARENIEEAIVSANMPGGTTWKQIASNNPDSQNKGLRKIFEGYFGGLTAEKMCQHCDGTTSCLRGKIIVLSSLQRTNRKQNSILHSLNIQRHHAARTRQLRG